MWKISRSGSWRSSTANRHHTRGVNRRQLDGDECFPSSARRWRRRPRGSRAENKRTLDSLAEGLQFNWTAFNFFYNPDPSMIWTLQLKCAVDGLVPHRNIFRETEQQKSQTEIAMYFYKVTPTVPASPAPHFTSTSSSATSQRARPTPLPPPPPHPIQCISLHPFYLCHPWDSKTNASFFSSSSAHLTQRDRMKTDGPLPLNG